jgi:hypothetical protein
MANAMTHIATATLSGAASNYSFQFTSIPQTYKHLRFVIGTASRHNGNANAGANAAYSTSVSGTSTSQTTSLACTSGGSTFSGMGSATTRTSNYTAIGNVTGNGFWDGTEGGFVGCGILDLYNYADTTYFKPRSYILSNANGVSTNYGVEIGMQLSPSTSAVSAMFFDSSTGTGDNGYGSTSYPMHVYLFGIGAKA